MKYIQIIFLSLTFMTLSTMAQAQLSAADVSVQYNKETKKLQVIKKADKSNVTAQFTMEVASLDIFDSSGSYAGSIEMKTWAVPVDQFASGEIVKIASICVKENSSAKSIELNDLPLEWE
jgi:predicted chitinase